MRGLLRRKERGRPSHVDRQEPKRVADAVEKLGLKFAVVVVNRYDLNDGGASIFADTIRAIHDRLPIAVSRVSTPRFPGELGRVEGGDRREARDHQS